jgi:uncharacterized membrane protein
MSAIESLDQVDGVAASAQRTVRQIVDRTGTYRILAGEWLGHPVHPLAVQLPIGLWLSSAIVDLMPGHGVVARRLIGAGLLAVPPAAAAGAVDWSELDGPARRVGLVHAVSNVVAAACYLRSYRYRRQGRGIAARAWALIGLTAVTAGGTLGGHLSYAQGAGVFRWSDRSGPPAA